MIEILKKLNADEWFLLIVFVVSLMLSFLFGYTVFRYWQIEVCKSPMEVVYN